MSKLNFLTILIAVSLFGLFTGDVLAAEDWYPSDYGEKDTIGAANNLSASGVLNAIKLVDEGKVYSLGVVTSDSTPTYTPRKFQMVIVKSGDGTGLTRGTNRLTGNDDLLISHLGIGTQIDGFGHIGINHQYYNGVPASEIFRPDGLIKFGTENIPPIVTRGVMLDMANHDGLEFVEAGVVFNEVEIKRVAKTQGVNIGKGDVVIFHTGWLAMADKDAAVFIDSQPGLGVSGARYLADKGVVAVGADTAALEVIPFEHSATSFPVHQELLTKNGVYILETLNTKALARNKVYEFLFVLGQPRFKGAVQMVINPIAIK